ncbi:MAG TPA: hypothetical protein VGL42_14485 [Opitutaceae bacterium]|jgi:hypothetical protein
MVDLKVPVTYLLTPPVITSFAGKLCVLAAAYIITLGLSGTLVRFIVLPRKLSQPPHDPHGPRFLASTVIGKCENLLALTFVIIGQETGLALIFAAKALVRAKDIEKNPGFYLGGMLVNLIWSLVIGVIARALIAGL